MLKFFEFKETDIEEPIKSFYLKDELNPKIWDNFELNNEIRESLLQIAKDFFDAVELGVEVKDIALCGSLCNYNWSEKYSDYDLHIILNYSDIDENFELVEKLCDYAKKQWNLQHDIEIEGYEVEVAIQDEDDLKKAISSGRMGGVFSLMKNKWIKKPEKIEFEPDEKVLYKKAKSIMDVVDGIEEQVDEDKYTSFKEKIDKVWKKIKDLRKSGLESSKGEYSTGNLLFKLLRRNNYIGKIMDLKRYAYDKQFESSSDSLSSLFYSLEELSDRLKKESEEGWLLNLEYTHDEKNKIVEIDYSCHGHSDGFSDNLKVYYGESPIRVERNNQGTSTMGDYKNNRTETFNSFEELVKDIKDDFGI